MEYYPTYIIIKKWIQKNLFISSLLFSIIITMFILTQISQTNIFSAGKNYKQTLLEAGRQEILFHFDKNMIEFGSYETNSIQWNKLMNLSFDPPLKGSIRSISARSFAYVLDTPTPIFQDINITYNKNIKALDKSNVKLKINYQDSTSSPFTIKGELPRIDYATKDKHKLTSPIFIYANSPLDKKMYQKAIRITNSKGHSLFFRTVYDISTNYTGGRIAYIQTNYNIIKIIPYLVKKHQNYSLQIDYKKIYPSQSIPTFTYDFSTYASPQWLGISQNPSYDDNIMPLEKNSSSKDKKASLSLTAQEPFWILHNTELPNSERQYSTLSITPEVSNLKYSIQRQGVKISGDFKSGTKYNLTFTPKHLIDRYKQRVSSTYETNFIIHSQKPQLKQIENLIYVDRQKPVIRYQTLNITNVTISYQLVSSAYYTATTLYGKTPPIPVHKTNFVIESPKDQITWQEFDLSSIIKRSRTAMLVRINIQSKDTSTKNTNFTDVLLSSSSITAYISSGDLLLQVKDIHTQEPLELMMISIWDPVRGSFQDLGRTKDDGTLRVPNPKLPRKSLEKPIFIGIYEEPKLFNKIAFLSGDESIFEGINESKYFYSSSQLLYNDISSSQHIQSMISTDRPNYQLGENIYVHALARGKTNNSLSSKTRFFQLSSQITVLDPQQRAITNFYKQWNKFGSMNFLVKSNQIKRLGLYTIKIENKSMDFYAQQNFNIEAITPKKAEILLSNKQNNYRFGDTLEFSVQPRFLYGQTIPSTIDYNITGYQIPFYSKNYPQYTFKNLHIPRNTKFTLIGRGKTSIHKPTLDIQHKLINTSGENLQLAINTETKSDETSPISTENNDIKVYQPYQLGIYTPKTTITKNSEILLDLLILDPITDNIISNKVLSTLTITKKTPVNFGIFGFITNFISINTHYQKPVYNQNIFVGNAQIKFQPQDSGTYQVTYSTFTNNTYLHSQLSFVVLEEDQQIPQNSQLTITSDKSSYESGEKAHIFISNPFENAKLLLTIERDSIREYHSLKTTDKIITHPIVLTYKDEPGINISAVLSEITNDYAPNVLAGEISIPMTPANKTLQIIANTTKSNYLPQEEITVELAAYNMFNQAIDGEAFVVIRDRSVINKNHDNIISPIDYFYKNRPFNFTVWDSSKIYYDLLEITNTNSAPILYRNIANMAIRYDSQEKQAIDSEVRSNFPMTLYSETIKLSKEKSSKITFKLPDTISEFDVSIIAYNQDQLFGKTNMNFTISKKLIVEDILPPFVRPDDYITWGAYIRNHSSQQMKTTTIFENNSTTSTQEVIIPANSSKTINLSTKITTNNTMWSITAFSRQYKDQLVKNIPVIQDNPWITSGFSDLTDKKTNIHLALQDAKRHTLQLQIATTPILKIQPKLNELLETSSLSFATLSQKLLLFLGNEDVILKHKLVNLSKQELHQNLQQSISYLEYYYDNSSRIKLVPNGRIYSSDPIKLLKIYEILLLARQYNYTIDTKFFNKMEKIALSLSTKTHPIAQVYALKLLTQNKVIDKDSFKTIYSSLPSNINSQAMILDIMYKMGYSLKNISKQTSKLIRFISETANEIIIPNPTRFSVEPLIYHYGSYETSIKLLNSIKDEDTLLFATMAIMNKYDTTKQLKANVVIDNQQYPISDNTNTITLELSNNANISIESLNNSPLFYNIIYRYIPKQHVSTIDSGYQIRTKIYDPTSSEKKSITTLKKDHKYVMELEITPKNKGSQNIELIIPKYAGITFEEKQNISKSSYIQDHDKIYLYTSITGAPIKLSYQFKASYQGVWTATPISVSSISSPDLYGIQEQDQIKIK